VLAGGTGLVALTGCTTDGSAPPVASSGSVGPSGASPAGTTPGPDADRAALDRAVSLSTDLLTIATDGGPSVDPGGRLAGLHTAHLAALAEATGGSPTASVSPSSGTTTEPVPSSARRARARLRRRELAAQRELVGLAVAAESGAVARLLASMSAGIAAHLVVT
jgi:hypothetical protein